MVPVVRARAAGAPTHRFQSFYVPNGMAMEYWTPPDTGTHFTLSPVLEPLAPYDAFFEVVGRDARRAQLAIQLVMAQPGISSQVIDNLNASVHLRALLTDLFLVDEILRPRASDAIPAAALAREEPPPADTSSTP